MSIVLLNIAISFLCGSIPTGYLVAKKLCGIDIRTQGSGNIGSTNVKRTIGTNAAIVTQIIDISKGIIPVALSILLWNIMKLPISYNIYVAILAITVILGHDYTPFLGFNGGKGVNTTIGAFLLIAFIPTIIGVAMYLILRFFTSIVSIRSIALSLTMVITSIIIKLPIPIIIAAIIAFILIVLRHKDNLTRIIRNEEK